MRTIRTGRANGMQAAKGRGGSRDVCFFYVDCKTVYMQYTISSYTKYTI